MFTQDIQEEIHRKGLITLTSDYYGFDEDEWEAHCNTRTEAQYKQDDHIQQILAIELSLFILRRVVGVPGETIDAMQDVRRKKIAEYEEYYGEYKDVNENVDF